MVSALSTAGDNIYASPALGDVYGDEKIEIVVGSYYGKVHVWRRNGSVWSESSPWPINTGSPITSSPVLADLDNDGDVEIINASSERLYLWDHDGTSVDGWPPYIAFPQGTNFYSSPAVDDIDNDDVLEIVVATWANIYLLDNGTIEWQKSFNGWDSSPVVGDIDRSPYNYIEIVSGSGNGYLRAWYYDGEVAWTESFSNGLYSSAIGDVIGGEELEAFVGCHNGYLYALDHNGNLLNGYWPGEMSGAVYSSAPALGDIDGDGDIEVLIGNTDHHLYAWHHNGQSVVGWPVVSSGDEIRSSPAIGDIDGDGDAEVVVGTNDGKVYAWDCPNLPGGSFDPNNLEWPIFHHDISRTGNYRGCGVKCDVLSVDGVISVPDVYKTIDIILEIIDPGFLEFWAADCSPPLAGNGVVDLFDALYIVTRINQQGQGKVVAFDGEIVPAEITTLQNNELTLAKGTKYVVPIRIETKVPIAGLQMEIEYDPAAIIVSTLNTTSFTADMTFRHAIHTGRLITLLFSERLKVFGPGSGTVFEIVLELKEGQGLQDPDFGLSITKVILATSSGDLVPYKLLFEGYEGSSVPSSFALNQNYPNPFNPTTRIRYQIPTDSRITLKVYNIIGQEVRTLIDEQKEAGYYTARWNGRDNRSIEVASGIYFYRLIAGDFTATKRMLLLK